MNPIHNSLLHSLFTHDLQGGKCVHLGPSSLRDRLNSIKLGSMSAAEIVKELEGLPESERAKVARHALQVLFPGSNQLIDRVMRRLQHPDIPEDFWEAAEEVEDGRALEIRDEHFENPPV